MRLPKESKDLMPKKNTDSRELWELSQGKTIADCQQKRGRREVNQVKFLTYLSHALLEHKHFEARERINAMGRSLAFHVADTGLIPDTTYDPPKPAKE